MKRFIIVILLFTLFNSCCEPPIDEDVFEFTESELEFLYPLKVSKMISFENEKQVTESILIRETKGESYNDCSNFIQRAPYNGRYVEVSHFPIDNWTGTSQEDGGPRKINYQSLLSMNKDFERNSINFSVSFKDFHSQSIKVGIDIPQTFNLRGNQINNCYKLEHEYPERIKYSTDIVNVYWTKIEGLVAYENKAGEIWIKK